MEEDLFQVEQAVIHGGETLLATATVNDFAKPFEKLLNDYKKLLKVSRRLVRMSDRSEEGLKLANEKIKAQQAELEKAHRKLELYANTLEEKVKERTKELVTTQNRLERLVGLGIALSEERNQAWFMEMILHGAKELTQADGGILFIRTKEDTLRYEIISVDTLEMHRGGTTVHEISEPPLPLRDPVTGQPNYFNLVAHTALTKRTVNVSNCYESTDFNFSDTYRFDSENDYRSVSFLAVPLKPRQGQVSGVLLLINARKPGSGRVIPFSNEMVGFVEALTSQAAVALENKTLVDAQEKLLESIIKLTAVAIDSKSPYTGGHCERVPEICQGLAKAACEANDGPFADFDMDDGEWHAFRLAAWLHDCGKVTTPEYVVDKATKLETIYNRIHEIRTRFEVVRRDYVIDYLQGMLQDAGRQVELKQILDSRLAALTDDFAFVAECNVGGEFMAPERITRLEKIAQTTWLRHFDDRLGLSHGEMQRLNNWPAFPLPARERLLADKIDHIIPRSRTLEKEYLAKYGIQIKPPKNLYNYGELYNLRVARGTLTEEERFKINDHIIQTIIMLEQLPFPTHLARVPEFAGGHHETMDGNGYPRKLKREEMSIQARMLAIADIFEALTATDRPYKKPKTLNESLHIMRTMRDNQHIDADLFDLFLLSGTWREYAERFLNPSQRDEVDIHLFLQPS